MLGRSNKRMRDDRADFSKAVSFLIVASILAGALNFLYQVFMGQGLGKDTYSELTAILSLFIILTIPAQIVSTVMARSVSKLRVKGSDEEISGLIHDAIKYVLIGGLAIGSVLIFLTPYLDSFLHLSSTTPIILLTIALVIGLIDPVGTGSAQGLQRFTWIGLQTSIGPLVKLVLGLALVFALSWSVNGAVLSIVVGSLASLFISFFSVRDYLLKPVKKFPLDEVRRFIIPVMFALVCFSILTNIDTFLVRHFLVGEEAGEYAAASTISKIILFLPMAICSVMFPKLTDAHVRNRDTFLILRGAIRATFLIASIAAVACLLFPDLIISMLYGPDYVGAADTLRILGFAMTMFGLTQLYMNYGLATDTYAFLVILAFFTILEIILIIFFHQSKTDIALCLLGSSGGIVLFSAIYFKLLTTHIN